MLKRATFRHIAAHYKTAPNRLEIFDRAILDDTRTAQLILPYVLSSEQGLAQLEASVGVRYTAQVIAERRVIVGCLALMKFDDRVPSGRSAT